jgi:hypothetical protein
MTAKERISFDHLVMEFERLRHEQYQMRVDYRLMAENVTALLELSHEIKDGLLDRLAKVVFNEVTRDLEDFKEKIVIEIKRLPCQELEDKQAFCRIADALEHIEPNEKVIKPE